MPLDFSSLKKAVASFGEAVDAVDSAKAARWKKGLRNTLRAGVIQNFEFTYELCWKFMKRWLETNVGRAQVEGITRRELFRLAAEHLLIADVEDWMVYHDARNETAHVYDEKKAQESLALAKRFLPAARKLLAVLEKKND